MNDHDPERAGGQPGVRGGARRARRHDPGRRDRLVDTALAVIAERGVAGTSHREIARAADVPLGSMTYHFASLDEVLTEAFARHAAAVADTLDRRMRAAPDRDAAVEALVGHIVDDIAGRDLVLALELYAAAARTPALRAVTEGRTRRGRDALARHFGPSTTRRLDALVEGLVLHRALSTDPMPVEEVRAAVRRLVD